MLLFPRHGVSEDVVIFSRSLTMLEQKPDTAKDLHGSCTSRLIQEKCESLKVETSRRACHTITKHQDRQKLCSFLSG